MKQIVIVSGKGGTGKTSVTAGLAALAGPCVLADCDVDAADLHLVLAPSIRKRTVFRCGHEAVIRSADCTGCGVCEDVCRFEAIEREGAVMKVSRTGCEGCGVCVTACPVGAIDFPEREGGEWFVSETRCGPMVHARLIPGAENSGKLVAQVREEACALAKRENLELILIDGPPGIGCPVIASVTGADLALIVTEPTLSGAHDLERLMGLLNHFKIPAMVSVNKWDINPAQTEAIEQKAVERGGRIVARIPYDRKVTRAQLQRAAVTEMTESEAGEAIKQIWAQLRERSRIEIRPHLKSEISDIKFQGGEKR
jgi:MinD superfamily P-loop ATPase